jgi:hypothetical protein
MGRPIRTDRLGVQVFGTYEGAAEGIRGEAYFASNQNDVFIIKQKGARRYLVADVSTVNDEDIALGSSYVITSLGTTDWAALGCPGTAFVGKVFRAKIAGSGLTTTGTARLVQVAKLVSGAPAAAGEMRLQGFIGGNPAQPITLRKLNKRTATSFAGARYTWLLNDDSTAGEEGRINLTLIS